MVAVAPFLHLLKPSWACTCARRAGQQPGKGRKRSPQGGLSKKKKNKKGGGGSVKTGRMDKRPHLAKDVRGKELCACVGVCCVVGQNGAWVSPSGGESFPPPRTTLACRRGWVNEQQGMAAVSDEELAREAWSSACVLVHVNKNFHIQECRFPHQGCERVPARTAGAG